MRVNFSFKGFSNNRLVMGFVPMAIGVVIFFIASSFTKSSDHDIRAKQVNLMIRQIGHMLLLQAGDSTSRVLPVTEINEGTFLLGFENEFVFFNHDSLMVLSQRLLPKTMFPSGYTVTVHDCLKASIVYGFQINNTSPDILACTGRSQPRGCYTIEFAFADLYEEKVAEKKADIDPLTKESKSVKVYPQEVNPKPEEIKTTTIDNDINPRTEELKSVKADPQEANSKLDEIKTTAFDLPFPLLNLVYTGLLVLLGVTLLIGRFGKRLTPVLVQNQNHAITKQYVPELPALGKFLFDVKDQRLVLGSEVINLTDKECRILELLNNNFGELISRETLMLKIWINEGVITGRSLDMFVSKLRKKLSSDPALRITNVHGKGYKLEMPGV